MRPQATESADRRGRYRDCPSSRVQIRRIRIPLKPHTAVLVVSDDGDLRAALSRVLQRDGFSVTCARHAGHAVLVASTRPAFDVLVVDAGLADGAAANLATALQRRMPDLGVLYLGTDAGPSAAPALRRPFTADDLLPAVRAVAHRPR